MSSTILSVPSVFQTCEEVLSLNRPTLKYIHKDTRPTFSQIMSDVLFNIYSENSIVTWTHLVMLPKCVLPSSKRSGKNHKKDQNKLIIQLCDQWLAGDILGLWSSGVINARSVSSGFSKKLADDTTKWNNCRETAISLAQDGLFGKACQVLFSNGLAPNNVETWKKLQSKHPSHFCPIVDDFNSPPLFIDSNFDILKLLRSFPA